MLFEVLLHKSKLERNIMKILVTDTSKSKYCEKGCHYLHVLDELHKTLQYSKLKKEALMFCLQKLEAQSDVIRTTHAHYLPCGD
ncbi:CST complex subunit STN1-like [Ruditapes philippinarum]|uniref:CST complex subunit STN1-like n=1 Tax=Ruditapes philippinarum TaxID=129788 RepID=UPI00295B4ECB|nr:CST complex subunit STN1-like [Ruditapes philippinarum]